MLYKICNLCKKLKPFPQVDAKHCRNCISAPKRGNHKKIENYKKSYGTYKIVMPQKEAK